MERWDDLSNYQWSQDDTANDALMEAIKASGALGVYIEAGLDAAAQWDAADRADLRKRGYVYLNFPGGQYYAGIGPAAQVTAALATFGGRVIERLGLDCEDPGNTLDVVDTVAFIKAAVDACAGRVFSDIYTAPAWWKQYTANTIMFAAMGMLLWLANPTGIEPTSLELPVPFGGWTFAYMIQFDWHGKPSASGPEVDEDVGQPENPDTTTVVPPSPEVQTAAPVAPRNAEFIIPEEEDPLQGMTEVTEQDAIKAFDDAAAATLGRIIGGDAAVKAYVRKEVDGTITFTVTGGNPASFEGLAEIA